MTLLLRRVNWPALLSDMRSSAGRYVLDTAAWHTGRARFLSPDHTVLAVLATAAGTEALAPVVDRHGTGDPEPVAGWLYGTSRAALRLTANDPAPTAEEPPQILVTADPDPLYVGGCLPALPCLDLATAHTRAAGGHLVVQRADLPPGVGGRYSRSERVTVWHGTDRWETTAAVVTIGWATDDVEPVWCHELAHHLDPAARTPEASETFGALLVEHQPVTLPEAVPLIRRADAQTGTGEQPTAAPRDLPAPGLPSVLAFARLPLAA